MVDTIAAPATVKAETNNPSPYDIRTEVYKGLIARGMSPQQAMGSIYGLMGESGTALDPNAHGDSGNSVGIGQWNGKRRANLEATAAGMNTTWNDPRAQVQHLFNEIDGPEKAAFDRVKSGATTAADATNLWTAGFERPAKNNWQQRYIQGSQAGRVDTDGNPIWKTGPAAPLPAAGSVPVQGPNQPADTRSPAQKFSDAAKAGDVGGALASLSEGQDSKGKDTGGLLGKLGGQAQGGGQQQAASTPLLQAPPDSQGQQAAAGQALLGQLMEQTAKPLTWSSRPYGSGIAGPQVPGTTLNSMGQ